VNDSQPIVTGGNASEADDNDRLKDLAQLSAAVGHFLINAFSAVVSNAEQIRSRARGPLDATQIEALGSAIVKTAIDASKVARRLIDCTRHPGTIENDDHGSAESRAVDINQLIREMNESTKVLASSGIDRVVNLNPIPSFAGDASRLRSMFRHLVQNAIESMDGEPGTLSITSQTDARGWAIIEIGDTGCGMSPEVLKQATEPFFSTKPDHAGIGLTIAQAIWRRHRGSLSIDSPPGRGTTIRLTFGPPAPARQVPRASTSTQQAEPAQPPAAKEGSADHGTS
jgi:two-component system, NtrC family, sensor kinase